MIDLAGETVLRLGLAEDWERAVVLALLLLALLSRLAPRYSGARWTALRHAGIWLGVLAFAVWLGAQRHEIAAALFPWRAVETGDRGTVELRRARDGHFHARLVIDGVPVRALIDTGASDLVLSGADAARVGIVPAPGAFTTIARTANGTARAAPVTLGEVALGPFVERRVPALVMGQSLDVSLIGMRFLDRFGGFSVSGDRLEIRR